ncbi:MAG: helix-hairpin-helix domain-containing protein [Rubrivivax sp.]
MAIVKRARAPNNAPQPVASGAGQSALTPKELTMIRTLIATLLAAASLGAFAAADANKASKTELETVAGVGPALSGRILAERQKAPFKDWPDMIQRVQGVGPASAARLSKGGLTVASAEYKAPLSTVVAPAAKAPAAASRK